jgi:hypothetical protein
MRQVISKFSVILYWTTLHRLPLKLSNEDSHPAPNRPRLPVNNDCVISFVAYTLSMTITFLFLPMLSNSDLDLSYTLDVLSYYKDLSFTVIFIALLQ